MIAYEVYIESIAWSNPCCFPLQIQGKYILYNLVPFLMENYLYVVKIIIIFFSVIQIQNRLATLGQSYRVIEGSRVLV